ncbi:hypothetical protein AVEN_205588-1 [Araneus ventricosus]|uniref:Uncharacterized protein n=1 Tax=Araneus ventricosus TaxID=182803 RepID=A0A4Y2F836_ARAVE|nr:hypothetical protein AVEN_205588-1 [Araneus ventricosus]
MEIQWEFSEEGNLSFGSFAGTVGKPEAQSKSDHAPPPMSNPYIAAYLIFIAAYPILSSKILRIRLKSETKQSTSDVFLSSSSEESSILSGPLFHHLEYRFYLECRGYKKRNRTAQLLGDDGGSVEQPGAAGDEHAQEGAANLPAVPHLHVRLGPAVLRLPPPHVHRHRPRIRRQEDFQPLRLHVLRDHGLILRDLRHGGPQPHRRSSLHESLSSLRRERVETLPRPPAGGLRHLLHAVEHRSGIRHRQVRNIRSGVHHGLLGPDTLGQDIRQLCLRIRLLPPFG